MLASPLASSMPSCIVCVLAHRVRDGFYHGLQACMDDNPFPAPTCSPRLFLGLLFPRSALRMHAWCCKLYTILLFRALCRACAHWVVRNLLGCLSFFLSREERAECVAVRLRLRLPALPRPCSREDQHVVVPLNSLQVHPQTNGATRLARSAVSERGTKWPAGLIGYAPGRPPVRAMQNLRHTPMANRSKWCVMDHASRDPGRACCALCCKAH